MFEFLSQKFAGVLGWLKDKGRLTEKNIEDAVNQVQNALLEADVPLDLIKEFLNQVKNEVVGKKKHTNLTTGQGFVKIVHGKLLDFLGGKSAMPLTSFQIPSVVMVMGLQGSGKTTSVAKIANFIQKQAKKKGKERKILLASVDFYRPAAVEQLKVLAGQIGVDFYNASNSDAVDAAKEIYNYFKKNSYQTLFLDTAGRLHIDDEMMGELAEIKKYINPKYKILVLDAMTGQESLKVAKKFNDEIGFNTAILSKMDSDTRGGAAFSFRYALNKSISFLGVGEKVDDLETFIPERMASRILGMGDILTLIEKAEENISAKEQKLAADRFMSGGFSLQDFLDQMDMVGKIGSLQKITKYLPGVGSISQDAIDKGQVEMKKFRAIILSMTKKERLLPNILDGSRKKRIAAGSGSSVRDVNLLLEKFEQSKKVAKMFKKYKRFGRF